jgi:hypothetical protein
MWKRKAEWLGVSPSQYVLVSVVLSSIGSGYAHNLHFG